ncbi:TPA: hypothetical protein ODO91_003703 [Escherichia coli]|uniref:Uncharacterized protein n=1 Tax=Enterobacter roggenkampii TaxID=1812935 RepID=A0ABD7GZW3_9ENTR|nr:MULTISPECIES: hypothetical protein [Enterobacteriaceae]EKD7755607.1 hypothetical protein [Shigella sonnei]EEW0591334.1 hypothetical protein [Escherichia coli]EFH3739604.1 hypothetical protein [Escherichia coli]EHJ7984225.1 hypothetical protein [Escherichia coli]EIY8236810.1 hypothetical protein [Escherichia coli]
MLDNNNNPPSPRLEAALHVANEMLEGDIVYRSELQSFGIDSTHILHCMRQELNLLPECHRGNGETETYWYFSTWTIDAIKENLPKYRRFVAFRLRIARKLRQINTTIKMIRELGFTVPDEMAAELAELEDTARRLRGAK